VFCASATPILIDAGDHPLRGVLPTKLAHGENEQHEQRRRHPEQRRVDERREQRHERERGDHEQAEHAVFPFPGRGTANGVAVMFWAYVAIVVAGLAACLAVGLAG
jgi:hypothetical protein